MIDWQTSENAILVNPRFPSGETEEIQRQLGEVKDIHGHVWMATSGSTASCVGTIKWTALSKQAILSSAQAVNSILNSDSSDVWLNPLPAFHVGGLGIEARAHLSGARVAAAPSGRWDPHLFSKALHDAQATLTALVPAQLYDLVNGNLEPPMSLRAVIVGGGALLEPLYQKAVDLKWRVLPSYGLTECSSQVATAELARAGSAEMPPLKILPHAEVKNRGCLAIKSPALLTCYAFMKNGRLEIFDPKQEGWFITEDRGEVADGFLKVLGRDESFVKIGGESCDLLRLERILQELKLEFQLGIDTALVAMEDPRLGHTIHLAAAGASEAIEPLIDAFQLRVLPFERIRKVHYLSALPRTPLSKISIPELKRLIYESHT